jgi:hypothetical protein
MPVKHCVKSFLFSSLSLLGVTQIQQCMKLNVVVSCGISILHRPHYTLYTKFRKFDIDQRDFT